MYGPHVNHSTDRYIREGAGIRVPLTVIKGIGKKFVRRIISERERGGLYRSIDDFRQRVKIPQNAFLALLNSGALEGLGDETRYTSTGVK